MQKQVVRYALSLRERKQLSECEPWRSVNLVERTSGTSEPETNGSDEAETKAKAGDEAERKGGAGESFIGNGHVHDRNRKKFEKNLKKVVDKREKL